MKSRTEDHRSTRFRERQRQDEEVRKIDREFNLRTLRSWIATAARKARDMDRPGDAHNAEIGDVRSVPGSQDEYESERH